MNPLVIEHQECWSCGAGKGEPCRTPNGCGMRLDDFAREAPLEARLDLHIEDEIMLGPAPPLWVSPFEICDAKITGLWDTVEARVKERLANE